MHAVAIRCPKRTHAKARIFDERHLTASRNILTKDDQFSHTVVVWHTDKMGLAAAIKLGQSRSHASIELRFIRIGRRDCTPRCGID